MCGILMTNRHAKGSGGDSEEGVSIREQDAAGGEAVPDFSILSACGAADFYAAAGKRVYTLVSGRGIPQGLHGRGRQRSSGIDRGERAGSEDCLLRVDFIAGAAATTGIFAVHAA